MEKKQYERECGKCEHDVDALFCTNCGKKTEETAVTASSSENYLG
ncbi:hypothetical protein [Scatolibacter rhodanostii]|nr:hypothetical protein [Scatolibacter rhodanostii]